MDKPHCPICQGKIYKDGKNKKGVQKWRCYGCPHYFVDGHKLVGRPTLGEKKMTNSEYQARHRKKIEKKEELWNQINWELDIEP